MSKKSSFWGNLFGYTPPRGRFTIEELRSLRDTLIRNPTVTEANRELVVETLRSLAELLIWGDQHEPRFFEFFLENNLLAHFHGILEQRANRRGDIAKQVLQTLSILIQNMHSKEALFYMFSNNHINDIVRLRLDFEDEEVLGYYINLLKAISMKLNPSTVHFFFQAEETAEKAFPLYTEAIKLVHHKDTMVRAASRTLTLNVYGIKDPQIQTLVLSDPARGFFAELATYTAKQCLELDQLLLELDIASATAAYGIDSCLAEIEDMLSYCNDILSSAEPRLCALLLKQLWTRFAVPFLLRPLHALNEGILRASSGAPSRAPSSGTGPMADTLRPICSLYICERLLHGEHMPNDGGRQHLGTDDMDQGDPWEAAQRMGSGAATGQGSQPDWQNGAGAEPSNHRSSSTRRQHSKGDIAMDAPFLHVSGARPGGLPAEAGGKGEAPQQWVPDPMGPDGSHPLPKLAAAGVRLLMATLQHQHLDSDLLAAAGLLPARKRKHMELLKQLTSPPSYTRPSPTAPLFPRASDSPFPVPLPSEGMAGGHRNHGAGGFGSPGRTKSDLDPFAAQQSVPGQAASGQHEGSAEDDSVDGSMGTSEGNSPAHTGQLGPGPFGRPRAFVSAGGRQSAGQLRCQAWIDQLCALLSLYLLPSSALAGVGWLLTQLAPPSSKGSGLTSEQAGWVETAGQQARQMVYGECKGLWCDALPCFVQHEWTTSRKALTSSPSGSTNAAVWCWLQARHIEALGTGGLASKGSRGGTASVSAHAAQQAHHRVQRLVTLLQIHQALLEGGEVATTAVVPSVTEAQLKAVEVREGNEVDVSSQLPCRVAFSRGRERSVAFALCGLPAAGEGLDGHVPPEAAATSMPCIVLAEPSPIPGTGMVVAVAPLMGSAPHIDKAHGRWLHVHVRPPVRGLLKVVKASNPGNVVINIGRQLQDGHWVLSFQSSQAAQRAKQLIDESTEAMFALYQQSLSLL
ncbi:hypothetical protein WJX84_001280 [Apatococcus fuscideae]|uniref:FPL domain-containing protein n=1 Tax=Apatococcus fuscideae TaxID=2026836 RepID=A0AAW1TKD9_9CHLO